MRPRLVSDIEIYPELLSIHLKISFREGSLLGSSRYSKIEPCAPSACRFHSKPGTNNQFRSISKITKVIPLKKISSEETNMLVCKFTYSFVTFFFTPHPNCKNANIKYNSYFICLHICTALFLFFVYLN